jgi:undecaprenyl-diphosphatase
MTINQAVISGIVQGITEFFPISSSGHLVLLHNLLGVKEAALAFDVFLHFGTLLSIILFFRKDIINMLVRDRTMLKFIIIGSIPTVIIGLIFKDMAESLFTNPRFVGISLIITGVFLFLASFFAMRWKMLRKEKQLGAVNSIIVGIAQGIAVVPGISRSGSTIGMALILGLSEENALKFSFLLALPAVLGANVLKAREICGNLVSIEAVPFLVGGIVAAITGLIAIKAMFEILRKNLFFLFGIYCMLIGSAVVILSK